MHVMEIEYVNLLILFSVDIITTFHHCFLSSFGAIFNLRRVPFF